MKENFQKLEKLLSDEAFTAKLFACKDSVAALKMLESKGVFLTAEELAVIRSVTKTADAAMVSDEKLSNMSNDELSDDELEMVAGGAPGMPTLSDFGAALQSLLSSNQKANYQQLNKLLQ